MITELDRSTAARMFQSLDGRERFAERALAGGLDHTDLLKALAQYRELFLAAEAGPEPLLEIAALNAAADYLDELSLFSQGVPDQTFAPALRKGITYEVDPISRAFLLHHRRLVKAAA